MKFSKKYKWLLPFNAFTLTLVGVRMLYTFSFDFGFIIWNLILAILPLVFSYWVHKVSENVTKWGLFGLWLLFFPNAFYVITDLFHLHDSEAVPRWFDLMVLFTAAFNGLLMGMASFHNIEVFLKKHISIPFLQTLYFTLFLMCGYGIYIGRYKRLNSWDIFANPLSILSGIRHDVVHPFLHTDWWMVSVLFAVWLYIVFRHSKRLDIRKTISSKH